MGARVFHWFVWVLTGCGYRLNSRKFIHFNVSFFVSDMHVHHLNGLAFQDKTHWQTGLCSVHILHWTRLFSRAFQVLPTRRNFAGTVSRWRVFWKYKCLSQSLWCQQTLYWDYIVYLWGWATCGTCSWYVTANLLQRRLGSRNPQWSIVLKAVSDVSWIAWEARVAKHSWISDGDTNQDCGIFLSMP